MKEKKLCFDMLQFHLSQLSYYLFFRFTICLILHIFREYVQRAFASVSNEVEKDRVESALKEKIEQAFTEGVALTKDWSQEPIPQYVFILHTLQVLSKQETYCYIIAHRMHLF